MNANLRKIFFVLFLAGVAWMGCVFWLDSRPVEIVGVHEDGNHSYVLVKNFPFTDKGQIKWWMANKDRLNNKYHIPRPSSDGYFTVVFWGFGDGYKEEGKYDRFCFADMAPPVNCIEKNRIFSVSNSRNMGVSFTMDNAIYRLKGNGEIVKDESD